MSGNIEMIIYMLEEAYDNRGNEVGETVSSGKFITKDEEKNQNFKLLKIKNVEVYH